MNVTAIVSSIHGESEYIAIRLQHIMVSLND